MYSMKEYKGRVVDIYEKNIVPDLENVAIEIKNLLELILNNNTDLLKNTFNLIHFNSGYVGRYYKVLSRVKSGESLGEKLVIKDDLLSILDKYPDGKEEDIKKELLKIYKDLIGIKILGDLQIDVDNLLDFLKENKHKFIYEDTYIEFLAIEEQPVSMKNGKNIIKIDAIYHKSNPSMNYNFELQIKNQLLSAWGDMEHQQFYKNNKFSPIRKSHEPIMQNVGDLLSQIDNLLLSVRESEKEYNEKGDYWDFNKKIEQKYNVALENVFGFNVNNKINDLIKTFNQLEKIVSPNYKDLNYDLVNFIHTCQIEDDLIKDTFIKRYLDFKKLKLKLRVFEAITITWYSEIIDDDISLNSEQYLKFLNWLYTQVLDTINDLYDNKLEDEDIPFDPIYYKLIENAKSAEYFIEFSLYENVVKYYKLIKDAYVEWCEEKLDKNTFGTEYFNYICYLGAQYIMSENLVEQDKILCTERPIKVIIDEFFEVLNKDDALSQFEQTNKYVYDFLKEGQ